MEQNATSSIVYTNTSLAWQTKSSERCADRQLEHDLAGDLRNRDLHAEADDALEAARSMPRGPEKIEALKEAGLQRSAADAGGISFAKQAGHGSKGRLRLSDDYCHLFPKFPTTLVTGILCRSRFVAVA